MVICITCLINYFILFLYDFKWSSACASLFLLQRLVFILNAYLVLAPLFVLNFKMCWYWCQSFSVLQSVRQRHGAAMKKNRLRSFPFSVVLFTHKSRRLPQSFFSSHLSLSLSFSRFHLSIFSLILLHQGKARLRSAIWISNAGWFKMRRKHKSHVYEFVAISFFFPYSKRILDKWKKRGSNLSYIPYIT